MPGHPHLQKFFDQHGILRDKFFGPAGFDGVLANVAFETHWRTMSRHMRERNAMRAWMRRAARSKNEFFYLERIIEGQQLRHDAAHGMAADDRLLDIQMHRESPRRRR